MSKKVQYIVTLEGATTTVDSIREVSEVLGRKVTKADVEAGTVPEVTIAGFGTASMPDGHEVALTDPLHREVAIEDSNSEDTNGEDNSNEGENTNPEDNAENNDEEDICEYCKKPLVDGIAVFDADGNKVCIECAKDLGLIPPETTQEQAQKIMDVIKDSDEEGSNSEDTNEGEDNSTGDNSGNDNPEDSGNDDKKDAKPTMADLMAQLKKVNDAKKAEQEANPKKGHRSKTIKFTGEYPEKGFFKEAGELKKFYKQLSDEQLDEWLELEGLEYKPCADNLPIDHMRKCMAILNYHFPKENKGATKSKSKYAKYSTEELLQMALDNDIEVPDAKGNVPILRMYCIMQLKKSGLLES